MTIVIVIAFLGILGALAAAGFFMLRRGGGDRRSLMARALTVRIALSVALFVFIWLAYALGWIQPTGIPLTLK